MHQAVLCGVSCLWMERTKKRWLDLVQSFIVLIACGKGVGCMCDLDSKENSQCPDSTLIHNDVQGGDLSGQCQVCDW